MGHSTHWPVLQTWVLPALLGLGLASATGLRTFLPLLMLALAAMGLNDAISSVRPLARQAQRQCADCHVDVHQTRLGRDCAACHNTRSFASAQGLQVHARTRLPLTGAHAAVPCESCHRNQAQGQFTALDTMMSSMNQTSSFLQQQLASLPKIIEHIQKGAKEEKPLKEIQ